MQLPLLPPLAQESARTSRSVAGNGSISFVPARSRPSPFGAAFDPLSYYVEFLTATVFDAVTFDAIFPAIVERNPEGKVIRGKDGRGLDFSERNVTRTLTDDHLAPAGAACLALAWQFRAVLLPVPGTPRRSTP